MWTTDHLARLTFYTPSLQLSFPTDLMRRIQQIYRSIWVGRLKTIRKTRALGQIADVGAKCDRQPDWQDEPYLPPVKDRQQGYDREWSYGFGKADSHLGDRQRAASRRDIAPRHGC